MKLENKIIPHFMAEALENLHRWFGRPMCFIDFEFNRTAEPVLNLVSCSLVFYNGVDPVVIQDFWIHGDTKDRADLIETINLLKEDTIFISYMVAAEARSFMALNVDPHSMDWVDLYAEWRQLTFNNESCEYGTYFQRGFKRFSVPPRYQKHKNRGKDNNKVGMGLVDCVGQMFGVYLDSQHKKQMRDLIISDLPKYSEEQKRAIMEYCRSDVLYLPSIWMEEINRLNYAIKLKLEKILSIQIRRGSYMVSIAKMESLGMPVNVGQIKNLRRNFEAARESILYDLVTNHFPFFEKEKKRKTDMVGQWKEKYVNFETFIESKGLLEKWPRTTDQKTGKPSVVERITMAGTVYHGTLARDNDNLEQFDGIKEIYEYRQAKKLLKQLAWFQIPTEKDKREKGDFMDSVGSDGRVRTFLGAFGTQTSRNAPKASRFILAMSNWLRCLIQPPPGYAIIAADFGSQEFLIAALMSGDPNMKAAYISGDPYLYFAKRAGAVPEQADPKMCKNPKLAPPELKKHFDEYKRQRRLFKSTTLGLQYGMGFVKLAVKLTTDMGEVIPEAKAKKLVGLHEKTYKVYWRWQAKQAIRYHKEGVLVLWDGWALLGDNDNDLSVKNFPVQGTGGVILREMVRIAHGDGLDVITPLHDAGYFLVKESEVETKANQIKEIMIRAFANVLGDEIPVRIDIDVHRHGEAWVEEKGKKYYELLNKYLNHMETKQDTLNHLLTTIYKR